MIRLASLTLLAVLGATTAHAADRNYLTVERTIEVARSADVTWKAIGDYCYIGQLLDLTCSIDSGDGGVGTLRRLNGSMIESLVGKTPHSYTYSQLEGARANTDYHGTLAVEPVGKRSAKILYTLVIDQGRLPPGTDLAAYRKALEDRFQGAIVRAKTNVEKLPR